MNWDDYLEEQRRLQRESAQQVQGIIHASGLDMATLAELAKLDEGLIDPAVAQAIRAQLGNEYIQAESTVKKNDPSLWRQRTHAIRV